MRRVIRLNLADNEYTALADFEAGDRVQVVSEIQERAQEVILTTTPSNFFSTTFR